MRSLCHVIDALLGTLDSERGIALVLAYVDTKYVSKRRAPSTLQTLLRISPPFQTSSSFSPPFCIYNVVIIDKRPGYTPHGSSANDNAEVHSPRYIRTGKPFSGWLAGWLAAEPTPREQDHDSPHRASIWVRVVVYRISLHQVPLPQAKTSMTDTLLSSTSWPGGPGFVWCDNFCHSTYRRDRSTIVSHFHMGIEIFLLVVRKNPLSLSLESWDNGSRCFSGVCRSNLLIFCGRRTAEVSDDDCFCIAIAATCEGSTVESCSSFSRSSWFLEDGCVAIGLDLVGLLGVSSLTSFNRASLLLKRW